MAVQCAETDRVAAEAGRLFLALQEGCALLAATSDEGNCWSIETNAFLERHWVRESPPQEDDNV